MSNSSSSANPWTVPPPPPPQPPAASTSVSNSDAATVTGPYVQSGDTLSLFLPSFWQRQIDHAEQQDKPLDVRHPALPLARIKKVMKADPEVKQMIAADVFISEITSRAFLIADASKRRTLSRADISNALNKSDQFDFLIDIVPRDELIYPEPAFPPLRGKPGRKTQKVVPQLEQGKDREEEVEEGDGTEKVVDQS